MQPLDQASPPASCRCIYVARSLFLVALVAGIAVLGLVGMKLGAVSRSWTDILTALFQ